MHRENNGVETMRGLRYFDVFCCERRKFDSDDVLLSVRTKIDI